MDSHALADSHTGAVSDDDLSADVVRRLARHLDEQEAAPQAVAWRKLIEKQDVDLDIFRRILRGDFADRALSRHRIYLDTNYWLYLRDAAFRKPKRPEFAELWRRLRNLARAGRVVCPVSYPFYAEVMKQEDDSRRRTACVVDRLSGGVCVVDPLSRIGSQLSHYVWTGLLGDKTLLPSHHFVWAPVSHVVGMWHADHHNLSAEANLMLQKWWYRATMFLRFSDMIAAPPPPADPTKWRHTLVQNLMSNFTRGNLKSLQATYRIEVGGMTDVTVREVAGFATDLFDKGVRTPLGPERCAAELAVSLACLITTGLKLGRITTQLPEYHIMGAVHASIRWARRRHEDNDLHDHQHATAALPYCDAFFTERGLRDVLQRGPFRLDRAYNCRVISDPKEALAYVTSLEDGNVT